MIRSGVLLILLLALINENHGCQLSFGDDSYVKQYGHCMIREKQEMSGNYHDTWASSITGCKADCTCYINHASGVAYRPDQFCINQFPCMDENGENINFHKLYKKENVKGLCVVNGTDGQCDLQCECKDGFVDYINSEGKTIKCGTCENCHCPVDLETGRSSIPSEECDDSNLCQNLEEKYVLENTLKCETTGEDCAINCECRDGYTTTDKFCDTFKEDRRDTTPSPKKDKSKDSGLNDSQIGGIAVAGVVALMLVLVVGGLLYADHRRKRLDNYSSNKYLASNA